MRDHSGNPGGFEKADIVFVVRNQTAGNTDLYHADDAEDKDIGFFIRLVVFGHNDIEQQ